MFLLRFGLLVRIVSFTYPSFFSNVADQPQLSFRPIGTIVRTIQQRQFDSVQAQLREMDQRLSEAVDAVTELSKKQKSVHEMLGHLLQDFNALKGQTQQQDPPMTIPDTQPYC